MEKNFSNNQQSSTLVSVIIPCYNQAKYLPDALNSLLAQTYTNWECIIVNDGSPDNTEEVAKELLKKDKRIKYITMKNGGPSASRNAGLKLANGEYIQFLDADDLLEKNKIAYQLDFFKKEADRVDIAVSGYRYFQVSDIIKEPQIFDHRNGLPEVVVVKDDKKDILKLFSLKNPMVISAPLYRKRVFETVGLFDENLRAAEDWDFHLRCAMANMVFHHTGYQSETKTLIRLHRESAMNNRKIIKKNIVRFKTKHRNNPHIAAQSNTNTIKRVIKLFVPPIVFLAFSKISNRIR